CDRDEDIPGFAVYFETAAVGSTWADVVFSMLSLGQRTARLWTVLPHMVGRPLDDAVEAFSDESFVPGIRRNQWHINHPERASAVFDDLAYSRYRSEHLPPGQIPSGKRVAFVIR